MNIQELYTLLKKYRERRCTIEESDKLNCWFEQFQEEADRIPGIPEEKLERLFSQIESKILFSQSVRQMQKRLFRRLAGLAAMIAVCTTAGYYLFKAPLQKPYYREARSCPYPTRSSSGPADFIGWLYGSVG